MRLEITYVHEPRRTQSHPYPIPPVRYECFLDALGDYAGSKVIRRTGYLKDVAATVDGFILLNATIHPKAVLEECPAELRERLAARLVPIELTQQKICEAVLDPLSLAAGIDSLALFDWELGYWGRSAYRNTGFYGHHEIGRRLGFNCMLGSLRYSYLTSSRHAGLPHLLVDYLRAL